jgi:predicted acetyltransferase
MDESVRLRPGTPDDWPAIAELAGLVFHQKMTAELTEVERLIAEPERSIVAVDGAAVVGHTTAMTREVTVPGSVVPAAHVTGVGVAPTHRRRGLLTAMMRQQLTGLATAGREPIAILWASETTIYPRFGYGPAAERLELEIATREVRLTAPPAEPAPRLRMVDPTESRAELAAIYERLRPHRIGWSSRPDNWWQYILSDIDERRNGATELHGVILDGPDGPGGYALWRVQDGWDTYGPNARVKVREVAAADPGAYTELWRFLLGIDLARSASFEYAAVDEPLQYLVDEPRRLGRTLTDALWVRLVDLPAALEARRYAVPLDVVLEVTDPVLEQNSGRWRLTGGPGKATCVRTGEPADLSCSVTELGAAYLGSTSLNSLANAGRVRALTGELPSTAFGWPWRPNPTETF